MDRLNTALHLYCLDKSTGNLNLYNDNVGYGVQSDMQFYKNHLMFISSYDFMVIELINGKVIKKADPPKGPLRSDFSETSGLLIDPQGNLYTTDYVFLYCLKNPIQ